MGMADLVAINGSVFKSSEAKISIFDRGFLYGDSVYEVARSYSRIFFELEKHMDRLFNSAQMIALDLGKTKSRVMDEIYGVYEQSTLDDAYMRIIITRGEGKISLDPRAATTKPNTVIIIKQLDLPSRDKYGKGAAVVISQVNRNPRKSLDPDIKSGNYLNNILAYMDAAKHGAFEAIMLNSRGELTEGTISNFFIVEKGVVRTAPLGFDILTGITRGVIQEICKKEGIPFEEAVMPVERAFKADECFVTGSTREVVPVTSIDGKPVGGGSPGPVTLRLHQAYKRVIQEYCDARRRKRYIL